jgi:acyl-CoA dehydrogenase
MADTSYLEWPFFEERHRRRAAELERFGANELAGLAGHAHDDDALDATCREIVRRLGRAGLLEACCVTTPDGAFDVRGLCLSREILARHEGLADFAFAMQGIGTGPISLFGTAAQRQAYLPPVTRGERIAAFALSEPQAGSDVGAIATTAKRAGDAYVLNGTKTWISNGGIADHYVVFARTGTESGSKGLSAFVVDAGTPGFTIAARIRRAARRARHVLPPACARRRGRRRRARPRRAPTPCRQPLRALAPWSNARSRRSRACSSGRRGTAVRQPQASGAA